MSLPDTGDTPVDTNDPFHEGERAARARKLRSLVIALALIAFVILIFAVTIIKLAGNAAHAVPQT